MATVSIVFEKYFTLRVSSDSEDLLDTLRTCLKFRVDTSFKVQPRNGQRSYLKTTTKIHSAYFASNTQGFTLHAGLFEYLLDFLHRVAPHSQIAFDFTFTQFHEPVGLTPRWHKTLYDTQVQDITTLLRNFSGIAANYTGYGKTVLLLCLLDIFSEKYPTLILVPTMALLQDIQMRSADMNLTLPHYNWDPNNTRNIVFPTGFVKSREFRKPEAHAWLQHVNVVLIDEAHHLSAHTWKELFRYLPQVKRSYGFTASPDVVQGKVLNPAQLQFSELTGKMVDVVRYAGPVRVKRPSPVKVHLVVLQSWITPKLLQPPDDDTDFNWVEALDTMIVDEKLAYIIQNFLRKFPELTAYIPVYTKLSSKVLFQHLADYPHLPGIYWSADECLTTDDQAVGEPVAFIKANIKDYRFIIATSLSSEGLDITELNCVIPLTGVSYRTVIQPAGRSSRNESMTYVLIYDYNNPLVLSQSKKRRLRIEAEYDILSRALIRM